MAKYTNEELAEIVKGFLPPTVSYVGPVEMDNDMDMAFAVQFRNGQERNISLTKETLKNPSMIAKVIKEAIKNLRAAGVENIVDRKSVGRNPPQRDRGQQFVYV